MIPRQDNLEQAKPRSGSDGSCVHLLWSVSTSEHQKDLSGYASFSLCCQDMLTITD